MTTIRRPSGPQLAAGERWGITTTAAGRVGLVRNPHGGGDVRTGSYVLVELVTAAANAERMERAHQLLWDTAEPAPIGFYAPSLTAAWHVRWRLANAALRDQLDQWREVDRSARSRARPATRTPRSPQGSGGPSSLNRRRRRLSLKSLIRTLMGA